MIIDIAGMEDGVVFIYTFNESRTEKALRLDLQIKLGTDMINNLRFMAVDSLEYLVVADQVQCQEIIYLGVHPGSILDCRHLVDMGG